MAGMVAPLACKMALGSPALFEYSPKGPRCQDVNLLGLVQKTTLCVGSSAKFHKQSTLSSAEATPQRSGSTYRGVRLTLAAPLDTRSALLRVLCSAYYVDFAL